MRAKKSLGQNFLIDDGVARRIVDALELAPDDTVIEIGPGNGALTQPIAERSRRVIAIEFDRDLIEPLRRTFGEFKGLEVVHTDALTVDFAAFVSKDPVKLAANLPYNISTPILQRLIDQRHVFESLVLMFQREVVDRITAGPGGKERGFLSVLVENAFTHQRLFDVPPVAFRPVPKVWSSVVKLWPKPAAPVDNALFRRIVSASFAMKRKTILNNLKPAFPEAVNMLQTAGVDPRRRAESLTLDEWRTLVHAAQSLAG